MAKKRKWSSIPNGKLNVTTEEIAWVAGFLEGEACFSPTRDSCMIQVAQVQRWPLTKLQQIFGGRVKIRHNSGFTKRDIWFWQVSGERARRVARAVLPYMSPKRRRKIMQFQGL